MLEWDHGPKVKGSGLYLDSRRKRALSFVSHAHSDHVASHDVAIATTATRALAKRRIGQQRVIELAYGVEHRCEPAVCVTLHPAGHVLGSAMAHVRRDDGRSLLYTGDFKLRPSLTAPTAEPPEADVLVMESTFGKPFFRFPPWQQVAAELVERVAAAMKEGRQPIVMGYSLGKAQEIVRILTDAGLIVTEHEAVARFSEIYEAHGVSLGRRRRFRIEEFHGPNALSLEERGVIVAPPQVARGEFTQSFDKRLTIMCSGWALLKGASYRYGVDHVLPISDHADFGELLEIVERVRPKKVYSLHGYPEFAEHLAGRGIDAETARPDPQMKLFG